MIVTVGYTLIIGLLAILMLIGSLADLEIKRIINILSSILLLIAVMWCLIATYFSSLTNTMYRLHKLEFEYYSTHCGHIDHDDLDYWPYGHELEG